MKYLLIIITILSAILYSANYDDYSKIVVLPNPYNLSDETHLEKGMLFLNMPQNIKKIIIFSFNGTFIKELTKDNEGILVTSTGVPYGVWYGKNKYLNEVASGLYYYCILDESGIVQKTGKICIVK